MPELPEVETTCRGISPYLIKKNIQKIEVRNHQLRWPVPTTVNKCINQQLTDIQRRGKYIIMECEAGSLIWHLGMSGHMRILNKEKTPNKHDHVDMIMNDQTILRLNDPRKFGALLFAKEPKLHPLLANLGPEPLSEQFNTAYLYQRLTNKQQSIKQAIMDSHIVPGVGNIYASESLFRSKINPKTKAGRLSKIRVSILVESVKSTLKLAIEAGGTSLRDFSQADGKPGYFKQQLMVYGRKDQQCYQCNQQIKHIIQGQRATYYCPKCQT
ncbi:MAG: bifunctional DNA-formamidopyrimidine glycosylase/DNA-(apurinic or apyrimidinic site) lyase [bacterium]